jgi:uncharacterized protein (DUF58 family)
MPLSSEPFPGFSEALLRRLARFRFRLRPGLPGRGVGEHLVRKGGASVEFSDFRTYSFGDDFRLVDWNSYARLDRLFVKVFRDEEGFVLHLLLDRSRSMDWGRPNKWQFARRLAAALGYVALSAFNWVTVQALPDSFFLKERRGRGMIPMFFQFLDRMPLGGSLDLSAALEEYARSHVQPGLLVMLTDALTPRGVETGIKRLLARGHQVVLLHILAPEEINPSMLGDLELEEVEWRDRLEVSLDSFAARTYRYTFQNWRRELEEFCLSHQVPYFLLSSDQTVEDVLLERLVGVLLG